MAHRKLRNDTTVMVYKYGAIPCGELPAEFWATAKTTKDFWNGLVQMRDNLC